MHQPLPGALAKGFFDKFVSGVAHPALVPRIRSPPRVALTGCRGSWGLWGVPDPITA